MSNINNVGTFVGGQHGSINSFYIRLSRYGNLGWFLFAATLTLFIATLVIKSFIPAPVMVVDKHGNFLGSVTFSDGLAKTDSEILGAAERFAMCYWSLNSPTIEADVACALHMMDTEPFAPSADYQRKPMRERRIDDLTSSNFVAIVKKAKNRTAVVFDNDEFTTIDTFSLPVLDKAGIPVINDDGTPKMRLYKRVIISGEIQAIGSKKSIRNFKQELMIRLVPRTTFDHTGVLISDINDL